MTTNAERSSPAAMPMALFRNIGNRFRRPDVLDASPYDSPSTMEGGNTIANTLRSGKHGLVMQEAVDPAETPDLYYEDRPLGVSIHTLEQVRGALRHLASSSNDHARMLQSSSTAQQSLGDALISVLEQTHTMSDHEIENENDNAHQDAQKKKEAEQERQREHPHFANFLPQTAIDAQNALGGGMVHLAEVSGKLSVAVSKPINDLTKSFEDRYLRKIIPLRKRYIDQKGQYLKYMRCADMADTDEKRSYYEALADAAKPVWLRTSTELRTEADVMTELTAKNIAQWSRTIALQHERAFAISNANMAEAFTRAKELTSLNKS